MRLGGLPTSQRPHKEEVTGECSERRADTWHPQLEKPRPGSLELSVSSRCPVPVMTWGLLLSKMNSLAQGTVRSFPLVSFSFLIQRLIREGQSSAFKKLYTKEKNEESSSDSCPQCALSPSPLLRESTLFIKFLYFQPLRGTQAHTSACFYFPNFCFFTQKMTCMCSCSLHTRLRGALTSVNSRNVTEHAWVVPELCHSFAQLLLSARLGRGQCSTDVPVSCHPAQRTCLTPPSALQITWQRRAHRTVNKGVPRCLY